jgi:hypothetical protein
MRGRGASADFRTSAQRRISLSTAGTAGGRGPTGGKVVALTDLARLVGARGRIGRQIDRAQLRDPAAQHPHRPGQPIRSAITVAGMPGHEPATSRIRGSTASTAVSRGHRPVLRWPVAGQSAVHGVLRTPQHRDRYVRRNRQTGPAGRTRNHPAMVNLLPMCGYGGHSEELDSSRPAGLGRRRRRLPRRWGSRPGWPSPGG